MVKVFAEYKVKPECRQDYLEKMEAVVDQFPELELLEGLDQSCLFVEIWSGIPVERYEKMKEGKDESAYRLEWLTPMVSGGREKIHIWAFADPRDVMIR